MVINLNGLELFFLCIKGLRKEVLFLTIRIFGSMDRAVVTPPFRGFHKSLVEILLNLMMGGLDIIKKNDRIFPLKLENG
jgi:hypothetical protein